MTILVVPNSHQHDRLGLIASRKFGNAVARNRAKRRLREVFRQLEPDTVGARGLQGLDVVAIPRRAMLEAPYGDVAADLAATLDRLRREVSA